jgi:hypothetical protein
MTDNLKPAAPTRFYGFAHTESIYESLAALKTLEEAACTEVFASGETERACTEVFAGGEAERACTEILASGEVERACTEVFASGEAECAPSTSTEIVHVPRDNHTPSAEVQAVIEAILATPPVHQAERAPEERTKKRKRRPKKHRRPKTLNEEPQLSSLAMHEAQCMICGSECREEMDELFVNWHNVSEIGREFNTPRRTIYRHAHAVGLFPIRDRNLRRSLGLIIHRAETAPGLTADSVIRAVRTLAHINETGEWVNPPTHVIVSSGAVVHANTIAPSSPELLDTPCRAIESVKP